MDICKGALEVRVARGMVLRWEFGWGSDQKVILSQMLQDFVGQARALLLPSKLEAMRKMGAEEH